MESRRMHAEIISIGDEIASGQRLDTNSQWLSHQLGELGIATRYHTTVGDDLAANIEVFRIAAKRSPLILCTGGLGPTADDLTRQAIADAFGLPLELDAHSLAHIEALFAKRKRPMPERNRIQAMFPKGCCVVPNPHGSAPGIDLQIASPLGRPSRIVALPGVPAEMKEMWEGTVRSRLMEELGLGQQKLFYRTLKLYGIGESDVEVKLPDLIQRDRYPRVGITVSRATISLRIATQAKDEEESQREMATTVQQIRESFAPLIFGEGDHYELEHAVVEQLQVCHQSVSILEIGAQSLIAGWLQQADGSNGACVRGCLSFREPALAFRWASRNRKQVEETTGAVQTETNQLAPTLDEASLIDLADCVADEFGTDWSLVIGPYPDLSRKLASLNTTFPFALCIRGPEGQRRFRQYEYGGHPDLLHHRFAKTGLDQLRRELVGLD
jgi:nicotinamide-nucleotide amidase